MKIVAVLSAIATALSVVHAAPRVDSGVHRTLRQQGTVNLIVTMRDSPARVLADTQRRLQSFATRGDMLNDMVTKLKQHAQSSQAEITKLLAHESASSLAEEVKSFWVSNQVYFRGAAFDLVMKLAAMPGVDSIVEEQVRPLPASVSSVQGESSNSTATATASTTATTPVKAEWGVSQIQATDVWATGNKGSGVVVGVIDTGVRATHEALAHSFRRDHGWFDPEQQTAEPYDSQGHGSHVTGTIAGGFGIGVAPEAQWIMCKGCRGRNCYDSDLLACMQFMTCPTDPKGQNADCAKAPRVVNNSWSYGKGDKTFVAAIATWQQAGIIPVFALGNSGPYCSTALSPADYPNVISVGATDSTDALGWFSSRGPSVEGLMKPEVSAPGVDIYSASNGSDTQYVKDSGTSMASPHVAGAIALLVAAQPEITFDKVRELFISTTDQAVLPRFGQTCGDSADDVFPNNLYGHGRINVLSAIKGVRGPTPAPTPAPTLPDCSKMSPQECKDIRVHVAR